jgi:hypothetical protein
MGDVAGSGAVTTAGTGRSGRTFSNRSLAAAKRAEYTAV